MAHDTRPSASQLTASSQHKQQKPADSLFLSQDGCQYNSAVSTVALAIRFDPDAVFPLQQEDNLYS